MMKNLDYTRENALLSQQVEYLNKKILRVTLEKFIVGI